ncbi:MAG: hypothetical protein BJ554DRAFT_6321, partial [Olpidium bornovanus]
KKKKKAQKRNPLAASASPSFPFKNRDPPRRPRAFGGASSMSAFKTLVNGTECSGHGGGSAELDRADNLGSSGSVASCPPGRVLRTWREQTGPSDYALPLGCRLWPSHRPPGSRSQPGEHRNRTIPGTRFSRHLCVDERDRPDKKLRNRAFRGPERPQPLEDKAMVEQFFDPQRHEAETGPQPGAAFRFDEMRGRLDTVQMREGPASQAGKLSFPSRPRAVCAAALDSTRPKFRAAALFTLVHPPTTDWAAEFNSAHPYEFPPGEDWDKIYDMVSNGEMPGARRYWRDAFMEQKEFLPGPVEVHADFDKAFGQAFDWEEQFALAGREQQQQQQQHAVGERVERDWEAEFVRARIADGKAPEGEAEVASAVDLDNFSEFENIWKNLRERRQGEEGSPADPLSWEDEFVREAGRLADDRGPDPDVDAEPRGGRYVFERENPFLTHSDPFAEGLRLMAGAGPLQQTSLAFEAACQRNPSNSLAWTKLGLAQAENEKEDAAIKALETAIELDPRNAEAMMVDAPELTTVPPPPAFAQSLSISYINEGHDYKAYCILERWLAVRYPDVVAEAEAADSAHLELSGIPIYDKHARVRDM